MFALIIRVKTEDFNQILNIIASQLFSVLFFFFFSDSTNHANGEVIPSQIEALPEGSTEETTHDIKLVYESLYLQKHDCDCKHIS